MTLRLAVVGAESTGKSTLAQDAGGRVAAIHRAAQHRGARVAAAVVRKPRAARPGPTSRPAIAAEQQARIDAAAATHAIVVCDTTPLMTAVYSRLVFDDRSLDAQALAWHRGTDLTLLTALDLPWVADGLQRDGPQVRAPVDALLRDMLLAQGLPWALVGGQGEARLQRALDAVAPLVRRLNAPRQGLFTRLAERNAAPAARLWRCERCDDPRCEHLMQQGR